jgi:plasmid maintenance system antidote protein VapI
MNVTNRTLDRLMARYGIKSDYGLAKLMDVTPGSVSNWRKEKSQMADGPAIKAAALLDDDPGELLAHLQEERAETEEARKAWRHIAGRLRRSAAVLIIGTAAFGAISHAPPARADSPAMYIMLHTIRTHRSCRDISAPLPQPGALLALRAAAAEPSGAAQSEAARS